MNNEFCNISYIKNIHSVIIKYLPLAKICAWH